MRNRPNRRPRYAPEALEARISPSAIIDVPDATIFDAVNTPDVVVGWGVAVPAMDGPPAPPSGGTAPAPPPGNGDPPIEDPNIPIGPAVPV